jgi:dihydroneopterin aldolase
VRIELQGLELRGFHGVLPGEREQGQRFLVDIRLEPRSRRGAETDEIADAVDYRDVVEVVRQVSDGRAYHLLEALATALVESLLERLAVEWVEVRVRKPDVALGVPVEHAAVTVERYAETDSE